MKYFLKVFCQNNEILSPESIIDFIEDGFFFDEKPEIKLNKTDDLNWTMLIVYDKQKDPVILSKSTDDNASKKDIEEIKFVLNISKASKKKDLISERVNTISQVYNLQINQDQITDDCWEMLDSVEAMLMKSCDGMLFTSDNEFFDDRLKKIYKL
ncbi:MAG TPA: hypothetical protein VEV87_09280 [Chitinophagaceae bacterium]|nr:hypothetical protein [Chitinophagaceae bacterium]